jgi:hypothetical protein
LALPLVVEGELEFMLLLVPTVEPDEFPELLEAREPVEPLEPLVPAVESKQPDEPDIPGVELELDPDPPPV